MRDTRPSQFCVCYMSNDILHYRSDVVALVPLRKRHARENCARSRPCAPPRVRIRFFFLPKNPLVLDTSRMAASSCALTHHADAPQIDDKKQAGDGVDQAITEDELDGILDRERVFASSTGWGDSGTESGARWGRRGEGGNGSGWGDRKGGGTGAVDPLPREGVMYDVVDELDTNVLSAME